MKRRLTSKKQIIAEIKRLYRKREPLNITAVKREHPELIKAVYDIKPFWGWKRALEDAGVQYSKIRVELMDYLVCEICGAERVNLGTHLWQKHQIASEDYRIDYPDADLFSEELRARISKMKAAVLPHWEPLWTREYVMDRIMELHKLGFRLNEDWMRENERSLEEQATERFGCWSDALKAVGLDPTKIRINRPNPYKGPKDVLREVRRRKRLGLPVTHGTIYQAKHEDHMLVKKGKAFFGSWPNALGAAGIDASALYRDIRRQASRYPDKQSVIEGIKRRKEKGLPFNCVKVQGESHGDYALLKTATKYFGTWNKALLAAGVDTEELMRRMRRKRRRYPDKKSVISGIRKRRKAGLRLNTSALNGCRGYPADTTLYKWAREYFGSWNKALLAAGIDHDAIRRGLGRKRRRYPDKKSVISGIRKRRKAGLRLNVSVLRRGPAIDAPLWKSGREYFGSWENALRAAGIDHDAIRRGVFRQLRHYPDKKSVRSAIRKRRKAGLPLKPSVLCTGSGRDKALWKSGREYFGSWDNALRAAGLDPKKIRKRASSRKSK